MTGTHGKTTTSSMVVHALRGCGLDPSYLVGGEVRSTGTNAAWTDGDWLVVEADESDRSFLKLAPEVAVEESGVAAVWAGLAVNLPEARGEQAALLRDVEALYDELLSRRAP